MEAQETAPQIALRDCSRKSWGKVNILICDFVEGGVQCSQVLILQNIFRLSQGADVTMKGFTAFLDWRKCKGWVRELSSWKYLSKDLFHQFPWSPLPWMPLPPLPWMPLSACWRWNTTGFTRAFCCCSVTGKCQFVVGSIYEKSAEIFSLWEATRTFLCE